MFLTPGGSCIIIYIFLGKSWSNLGAICSRKYVPEANRAPISDGNFRSCCLDRRVCFDRKFKESYVIENHPGSYT